MKRINDALFNVFMGPVPVPFYVVGLVLMILGVVLTWHSPESFTKFEFYFINVSVLIPTYGILIKRLDYYRKDCYNFLHILE
jgi:hypothetical protein